MRELFPEKTRLKISLLVSIFVLALSAGCYSDPPVRSGSLALKEYRVSHTHPYKVYLQVKGRGMAMKISAFSPKNVESVSADMMASAIKKSNAESRLFDSFVESRAEADYVLDVTLFNFKFHAITVLRYEETMNVNWRLKDNRTGKTIYQRQIKTRGEASTKDALGDNAVAAYAIERATRANIKEAFGQLSRLRL